MFYTGLVMRHNKGCNPYGLIDDEGNPCGRKDTIRIFEEIDINDEELMQLNHYIREDRTNHSYYDNVWKEIDKEGNECNFISGKRQFEDSIGNKIENDQPKGIQNVYEPGVPYSFECRYKNSRWEGKIVDLYSHSGYMEFTVIGRGSSIRTYIGNSGYEIWACFPTYNKGCSLAEPGDLFWNSEKLCQVLDNIPDGITVANAIAVIGSQINDGDYDDLDNNVRF